MEPPGGGETGTWSDTVQEPDGSTEDFEGHFTEDLVLERRAHLPPISPDPGILGRLSVLVLSRMITFLYGVLLAHVLAMFRFPVKAGAFLVIDVGRRIYPDLTVASAGCWSHCRH